MARKMGCLTTIANIIWFVTGGIVTGFIWMILGILFCITIIGFPVAKQCFKFMGLTFFPFGKSVKLRYGAHPVANTFWLIGIGWYMFLVYAAAALTNILTIIGIPSAIASMRIGLLSFAPFGANVV